MSVNDEIERRILIERGVLAMAREMIGKAPVPRRSPRPSGPREAYWRSGAAGGSPWRGQQGELLCPSCRTTIASASVALISVTAEAEYEGREVEREVPIGVKVMLKPGYVNARSRHKKGPRWYVQGKRQSSPSPKVRLPAVVTCSCSQDVALPRVDGVALYATSEADVRSATLARVMVEEAEDQFIQYQVDLARGK